MKHEDGEEETFEEKTKHLCWIQKQTGDQSRHLRKGIMVPDSREGSCFSCRVLNRKLSLQQWKARRPLQ